MKLKVGWLEILLLGAVLLLFVYGIFIRPSLSNYLSGEPSAVFDYLIGSIYPRFLIESHRYPADQFIALADQIVGRGFMIALLLFAFIKLLKKYRWKRLWVGYWNGKVSRDQYRGLNFIFFLMVAYIAWDFHADLLALERLSPLYKPVSFLWLFEIPLPNPFFIRLYTYSLIVFCLLAAVGIKRGFFNLYILSIFIVLQAFVFSFEKTDHHLTTVTYALILMPFMHFLDRGKDHLPDWPLKLIQLTIVGVYFLAALEKLSLSGFYWPSVSLCRHLADLAPGVFVNDRLCQLIGYSLLSLEFFFPLALLGGRWRWVFLAGGLIFHLGNYGFTGIGGWAHPWWLMYMFFIDWSRLGALLKKGQIPLPLQWQ
jgi:hypothetical protein